MSLRHGPTFGVEKVRNDPPTKPHYLQRPPLHLLLPRSKAKHGPTARVVGQISGALFEAGGVLNPWLGLPSMAMLCHVGGLPCRYVAICVTAK